MSEACKVTEWFTWKIAAALSESILEMIACSHMIFNLSIPNMSAASNSSIAFYCQISSYIKSDFTIICIEVFENQKENVISHAFNLNLNLFIKRHIACLLFGTLFHFRGKHCIEIWTSRKDHLVSAHFFVLFKNKGYIAESLVINEFL
jgi:hypothetical protein